MILTEEFIKDLKSYGVEINQIKEIKRENNNLKVERKGLFDIIIYDYFKR